MEVNISMMSAIVHMKVRQLAARDQIKDVYRFSDDDVIVMRVIAVGRSSLGCQQILNRVMNHPDDHVELGNIDQFSDLRTLVVYQAGMDIIPSHTIIEYFYQSHNQNNN